LKRLQIYLINTLKMILLILKKRKLIIYRGWIRYSGSQFEARVGLQKINFGPAQLLRSLKWFARLLQNGYDYKNKYIL